MPNKKKKQSSKFELTPEALQELDKSTLVSLLVKMHEQYQQLSEAMQIFMREKNGPKTERFVDPDQLNLFQENASAPSSSDTTLQDSHTEKSATNEDAQKLSTSKKKSSRQNPRPSMLKHVAVKGKTPTTEELRCNGCNQQRTLVNEVDRGSRYAYIPASIVVEDFLAGVFACSKCGDRIVVEPMITSAALKLGADPALISTIAIERFEDSIPLQRQERRFARIGAPIAKSSMCGWLAATASILRPIYFFMKSLLILSKVVATDDTPMKVLDRTKSKNIKLGRVWTYRGDDNNPVNLFHYTTGRSREGPKYFLRGFKGYLLGDCFSGNQALCAETGSIHVACHAHARRYFIKAEPNHKSACAEILRMYKQLFQIEQDAKELKISGEALKLMREQESKPLLVQMKKWLDQHSITALPKSSFGKAVNYCLNNWTELTNYLLDGDLRIDNNLAEQEMKRVAINRKNSLFFGSDKGGEDAEVFMSLISTCRRHGIDPFAYLKDVIQKLSQSPHQDLRSLLPFNWRPDDPSAEIPQIPGTPKIELALKPKQESLPVGTL